MEKFIKDYGILVLVGVAIYWFFIREKEEEEIVVVDEGEGSSYGRRRGRKIPISQARFLVPTAKSGKTGGCGSGCVELFGRCWCGSM